MEEEKLTEARGEIIEGFIDLETMINLIISTHYLGEVSVPFYYEVLYDEYFSLGLKLHILDKIIQSNDRKHIQNLRRLSEIRNHFAHRGTQFLPPGKLGNNGMVGVVPDPKKLDKSIDYDSLYEEFQSKQSDEFKYWNKFFTDIANRKKAGNSDKHKHVNSKRHIHQDKK